MDFEMPGKGYRFRSDQTSYNIREIRDAINHMIYLTPPSRKNDLFEVRPILTFSEEGSAASLIRIVQRLIDTLRIRDVERESLSEQVAAYLGSKGEILLNALRYDEKTVDRTVRETLDQFVSASFCRSWKSPLMWGYYANGGSGWCLEYSRSYQPFFHPTFPMDVVYTKHRPKMTSGELLEVSMIFEILDTGTVIDMIVAHNVREYVQKLYLTKEKVWEHEEEFRIVTKGSEGSYNYPDLILEGIIFGINTDADLIKSIRSEFDGRLTFSQLEYQPDGYALQRRDLGD